MTMLVQFLNDDQFLFLVLNFLAVGLIAGIKIMRHEYKKVKKGF